MHWLRRSLAALTPLWLVMPFSLPLLSPLWRWTSGPCTHDGHLHFQRVVAMRHAWEQGLFFTRWLPDLALGYGYPFFVYREPMPLYSVLWLHLLGLPLPAATNLFYGLTILACGLFMFLWVRDVLGNNAALVSAVAYMASPYVLVDTFVRGNAPESLALPLLPLLMWSGRRWMLADEIGEPATSRASRVVPFLLTVVGLAVLSLSHNISTFVFVPSFLIYLLVLGWLYRVPLTRQLVKIALVFGLGIGMTLFYTGGALLEMAQVTLEQSTNSRNNDFHFNFTTLAEILAPVQAEDPLLLNPPLPFRLGWIPLTLALAGMVRAAFRWGSQSDDPGQRERQGHMVLMSLGAVGYLLMSMNISLPLWEVLPLIDFLQFPWRMVGRAALPVAFLAGASFFGIGDGQAQAGSPFVWRFGFVAALLLLLLEAIPGLYPNVCREPLFPNINSVHHYEQETGLVGVDPEGSYFPRTVVQRPATTPLLTDYQAGTIPQRFDRTLLPAGSVVHAANDWPMGAEVHLTSPKPFTARYLSFAFPGWQVAVDGQRANIVPSDPEGLITFAVPAGEHVVTIGWHLTPLRAGLTVVSAAAVLLTLAGAIFLLRLPARDETTVSAGKTNHSLIVGVRSSLLLGMGLLAFKLVVVDRVDTPWRHVAPPAVTYPMQLAGEAMRFLGYNLSQTAVAGGSTFDIDMAWTAVAPPLRDYGTNVWLVGPTGRTWSDKDTQRPRIYEDVSRTRFWLPGQWAWDSREVAVLPGTPPGTYDIVLTLFDGESLQPVTLTDGNGRVVGPTAVIGQVQVVLPSPPAALQPQPPQPEDLADAGLRLLGYNQDRASSNAGENVLLTLFWERVELRPETPLVVSLTDASGERVHEWVLEVPYPQFDWADWPLGQRLRSQHWLRLPAKLETGLYQFGLADTVTLGELQVQAPERRFDPPDWETTVGAQFVRPDGQPQVVLAGYTMSLEATEISLALAWQAETEMETRYRVFVHLVDGQGEILAQSDAEPAEWSRPTSGWVAGEYVLDTHRISVPAGMLDEAVGGRLGLYDPRTGERLLTEGTDFVSLPLP